MEEDSPMQRMKDSYNRVEAKLEIPKLKFVMYSKANGKQAGSGNR